MGDSFYVKYVFPIRFITSEMCDFLRKERFYDDKDSNEEIIGDLLSESGRRLIGELVIDDSRWYKGHKRLNEFLSDHKIPYDFYCDSGGGVYDSMREIHRPDMNLIIDHITDVDWNPVVKLSTLVDLLKSKDIKSDLERILKSLGYGMEIENYTAETELGRNPFVMDSIKSILDLLDNDKITQEQAFSLIKKITKEKEKHDAK